MTTYTQHVEQHSVYLKCLEIIVCVAVCLCQCIAHCADHASETDLIVSTQNYAGHKIVNDMPCKYLKS